MNLNNKKLNLRIKCAECGDETYTITGEYLWRDFLKGVNVSFLNLKMRHCPNCGQTEYCFKSLEDLIELVDKEAKARIARHESMTCPVVVEFDGLDTWSLAVSKAN